MESNIHFFIFLSILLKIKKASDKVVDTFEKYFALNNVFRNSCLMR